MNKIWFLFLSLPITFMKLFDFVTKLREKEGKEVPKVSEKKEKGVCIPLHALSDSERKKKLKDTDSLFDKIKNNKPLDDEELEFIGGVEKEKPISGKNSLGIDVLADNKKEERKETLDVIPEKKVIVKKEDPVYVRTETSGNKFRVSGTYDFGTSMMISGMVESGVIKPKMLSKLDSKKELSISEIKISSTKVNGLIKGEEGSIFVKTKGNPIIKYDDILIFK